MNLKPNDVITIGPYHITVLKQVKDNCFKIRLTRGNIYLDKVLTIAEFQKLTALREENLMINLLKMGKK